MSPIRRNGNESLLPREVPDVDPPEGHAAGEVARTMFGLRTAYTHVADATNANTTAIQGIEGKIDRLREDMGSGFAKMLGRLDQRTRAAQVSYTDDDGEDITGVHDSRQLEKAARALRDRNQDLLSKRTRNRIALIGASATALAGIVVNVIQALK